ncbi:hypothetical protein V6N12_066292 [Hibiscus sabdariffa]|uniref:Uncharacterized protein n=1 Tax=Hibiscus sabdariffa TaxID=183260 RepID=A0ABR2CQ58_9ROSI
MALSPTPSLRISTINATLLVVPSLDPDTFSIKTHLTLSFDHRYSPTKLMFQPNRKSSSSSSSSSELLDSPVTTLISGKFENLLLNPSLFSTTAKPSIVETQLTGHDKEVYDEGREGLGKKEEEEMVAVRTVEEHG